MRFERTKSNCNQCPLRDRRRIWSEGHRHPKIAFYGEAPGAEENYEGRPFVGPAGRYLNYGLGVAKIQRHLQWVSNIVSCKLPNNNWSSLEAEQARKCCKPGLEQELEWLRKEDPLLVPLGADPLRELTGETLAIGKARGSVLFDSSVGLTVIPTYHPAYLVRMNWKQGDTTTSMKYVWLADLKKIRRLAYETNRKPIEENFILSPSLRDVRAFVDSACETRTPIGVDVETLSLYPKAGSLVVVGLARSASDALSVPFLARGGVAYFSPKEDLQVRSELARLFEQCPLYFQNALFDIRHLRANGFTIPYENIQQDTLLLHHAISPELPHNLGFITSIYGSTPFWKVPFTERDGSILDLGDEVLRKYNLRDSVVLHQIVPPMVADVQESDTEDIYREESLPLLKPVCEMMDNGILLDQKKLKSWSRKIKRELDEVERELKQKGGLPDEFNLSSDDDLRLFLFGIKAKKFEKVVQLADKRKGTKVYQSLLDLKTVLDKTQPIILINYQGRRTKTNRVSVNKQGLLALQIQINNRLEAISHFKRPTDKHKDEEDRLKRLTDWLFLFVRGYRRLKKRASTYSYFPVETDGRVHPNFKIHGTVTGRLSSGGKGEKEEED